MRVDVHPLDFSEKWKFIVTPCSRKLGKNVMGGYGWSQGICLYICFHIKAYLPAHWIWSIFRKVKIHKYPLFGGRGSKMLWGVRVVLGYVFVKKNPNQSIISCPFNYNKISPPYTPPLGHPWGTSLYRQPQFFYGSHDSRYPKDSKSAKKYFP